MAPVIFPYEKQVEWKRSPIFNCEVQDRSWGKKKTTKFGCEAGWVSLWKPSRPQKRGLPLPFVCRGCLFIQFPADGLRDPDDPAVVSATAVRFLKTKPLPNEYSIRTGLPLCRAIRLQEFRRSPKRLGRTFVQRLKEVEEKKAALNREKLSTEPAAEVVASSA